MHRLIDVVAIVVMLGFYEAAPAHPCTAALELPVQYQPNLLHCNLGNSPGNNPEPATR
jgi:hypothetical protein